MCYLLIDKILWHEYIENIRLIVEWNDEWHVLLMVIMMISELNKCTVVTNHWTGMQITIMLEMLNELFPTCAIFNLMSLTRIYIYITYIHRFWYNISIAYKKPQILINSFFNWNLSNAHSHLIADYYFHFVHGNYW